MGGEGVGHGSMWAVGALGVVGAVWVAREGGGAVGGSGGGCAGGGVGA